jgi:DNA-binding GntR family transcriptional regulator
MNKSGRICLYAQLTPTLDRLFGMSRRLCVLALPDLGYLPTAVEKHLNLVESIKAGDADCAEQIMYDHEEFYAQVRETLITME